MKTLIKNILKVSILLTLSIVANAQDFRYPVVARITQSAPYPIYLSDYANPAQQNFSIQLQVRDNILATRRVRLKLFIESSSLSVQSTPVVRNETIIELSAGQTFDLPSNLVANYFENFNLTISPNQYAQSLPEGAYRFGIQVIDANTGLGLSGVQYAMPVWITVNEPPVWVLPLNESVQSIQNPQNVNFQWAPRSINVTDVEYEFTITELQVPLDYPGNIQNLFFAQPPHYTTRTRATNLNYNFTLPPLLPNKIYAYRVRAIAKNGLEDIGLFRNNGFSDVQWFKYDNELLPPFNEKVNRNAENEILLSWEGHDNDRNYLLKYRERGGDWKTKTLPKSKSEISPNKHEGIIELLPHGVYEFQVGAEASSFYKTAWGKVIAYKDSIKEPYNLKPYWFDSTKAYLSWNGYDSHKKYEILFANNRYDNWKRYKLQEADKYKLSTDDSTYAVYIPNLSWDSSYLFKVVAYDIKNDTIESNEAYLRFEDRDEVRLLLEEKSISGNILWAFVEKEKQFGPKGGSPQAEWIFRKSSRNRTSARFIHDNDRVSTIRYPLTKARIEVFADSACQVLLKTVSAGGFGNFNISFPAEALRGGLLPEKIYLLVKHEVFGTFKKEINSKSFESSLDIGEWVIPAQTFRLTPILSSKNKGLSNPADHVVKIYRRTSTLETAPYAKYENFKNGKIETEKINNEDYFLVAELKPGETAAGLFYSTPKFKHEYLMKVEGPMPYVQKLKYEQITKAKGTYNYTVPIDQVRGQPYIFGDISFENSLNLGDPVKLVLSAEGLPSQTVITGPDNKYRFNLEFNSELLEKTFNVEVYFKNALSHSVSVKLDPSSLGTRQDFLIKQRKLVAALIQLVDENNEPFGQATANIDGYSYVVDDKGWMNILALENSTLSIEVIRQGYEISTLNLNIGAQQRNERAQADLSIVRELIKEDFITLASQTPEARKPIESRLASYAHTLGTIFFASRNSDALYAGASFYTLTDTSKPKTFELTFIVKNKNTGDPIHNVVVNEDKLDVIGKTGTNGSFTYSSYIGRGSKTYSILPSETSLDPDGRKYAGTEVSFTFPPLRNNVPLSGSVVVELESGGRISGIVYEFGTTNRVRNVIVTIDFLGSQYSVNTNNQGEYSLKFNPTEEENFLTIETSKNGYNNRVVHMATSSTYGLAYTRDIYIKEGYQKNPSRSIPENFNVKELYGFEIVEIIGFNFESFFNKLFGGTNFGMNGGRTATIEKLSGVIRDKQGNYYEFKDVYFDIEGVDDGAVGTPLTSPINLKPLAISAAYADQLIVHPSLPIYLSPKNKDDIEEGIIFTSSFEILEQTLGSEILNIYRSHDKAMFYPDYINSRNKDRGVFYNNDISNVNFEEMPFPIAYSEGDIPIEQIKFIPKPNAESYTALNELVRYYEKFPSDSRKLNKLFGGNRNSNYKPVFKSKNVVFESLTVSKRGYELNNLVVMPIMSIPNIHISLLDIDKLRLAQESISEILIDYSRSPRKLSMGEDIVEAQIEEVYVESDGVDIVYFTNNAGNKIKANTESISEISYNANGIFYSDYKNQKEIVQTAAVLNEVPMFKIPKPAMGPGYRIKITASGESNADGLGYLGRMLENNESFASNTGNSFGRTKMLEENPPSGRLILEGIASLAISPHDFKLKWKYSYEKSLWQTELQSWVAQDNNFWGQYVLRPKKIAGMSNDANLEDTATEEAGNELLPKANINDGEIKIVYGVAIPLLSNFDMETEAQWSDETNSFKREIATAKGNFRIPAIINIEAGAMLFFDNEDKVNGLFLSVKGTLEIMGAAEISGAGGYVKVDNDIIWGGNLGVASEGGIGAPSFKMYSLKAGLLYDQKNKAYFMQLATSIGVGKEITIPNELVQYTQPSNEKAAKKTPSQDAARQATDDAKDSAIRQRWRRSSNALNPVYVGFDEMFIASTGRSGFEPKDHPFTLSDAECTVTFGSNGFTVTGAAAVALKGHHLLDGAFLVSRDNFGDWRVFVGIPTLTRAKIGPFIDFEADFQIDFGRSNGLGNFFMMGAAKADLPVHPIVYLKLSAKLVLGVNAQTDAKALEDATVAGGTTLSETAAKIVMFMGSSFNDIAEQSIQQRTAFFGAIPDEYKDSQGLFSGIYVGLKASVLVGRSEDFATSLVSGSARIGIGAELQAGILKSFNNESWQARFSAAIILDIGVKTRAPVDVQLFELTLDLFKICGAGGYDSDRKDWYFNFLINFVKFDELIGGQVTPGEVACNSVGFFYWRPCVYLYYYSNPEIEEFKNGKFVVASESSEDFSSRTCPIEW